MPGNPATNCLLGSLETAGVRSCLTSAPLGHIEMMDNGGQLRISPDDGRGFEAFARTVPVPTWWDRHYSKIIGGGFLTILYVISGAFGAAISWVIYNLIYK